MSIDQLLSMRVSHSRTVITLIVQRRKLLDVVAECGTKRVNEWIGKYVYALNVKYIESNKVRIKYMYQV